MAVAKEGRPTPSKCPLLPSGDGTREQGAHCGRVGRAPATDELQHVPEAKLGDIQVHEYLDELRGQEEEGGMLLHRLYLLVANEGKVGNVRGLGRTAPSQKGGSHPLAKEL